MNDFDSSYQPWRVYNKIITTASVQKTSIILVSCFALSKCLADSDKLWSEIFMVRLRGSD